MNPYDITAGLRKAGWTQKKIAASLKIKDRSTVSHVIHSRNRSGRVERKISLIIKAPLSSIWPDWYEDQGMAA
ncbi:MAG: transcriptional regulator [Gammaproteobacteria bacterium]|nr:transcriptional regulator [Gammaproteobacteria bacterium]